MIEQPTGILTSEISQRLFRIRWVWITTPSVLSCFTCVSKAFISLGYLLEYCRAPSCTFHSPRYCLLTVGDSESSSPPPSSNPDSDPCLMSDMDVDKLLE